MAERSRIRALQRIVDTSRKFGLTCTNTTPRATQTASPTPNTPTVLESLPEHKPLLPILLSHNIPSKLAKACADRYDSYAKQLRSAAETKFAPYLLNRRSHAPSVYYFFLESYNQTLRRWAQSVLTAALKRLKRDSVDLQNLDVTYPNPLWFPSPSDQHPTFVPKRTEEPCPLSPASAPPHAFPTTYPPPLRPVSELPTVEWSRTPATSSHSPSASTIDLDSLCLQFTKSLVIDENRIQPPQPKASIFSLPVVWKEGNNSNCSRTKLPRRRLSKTQYSQDLLTPEPTSTAPPLKVAKSRQLSVPPSFPSPSSKIRSTPRKASAPTQVLTSKRATVSPTRPDSVCHTSPITSPPSLNTFTADRLGISFHPDPNTPPISPQWSFGLTLAQATHVPQSLPYSLAGPATPPALSPDLFSEPIIVPSTPVHLSPASSLIPITDPITQFQFQSDYFLNDSVSPLDYSGLASGLATGGFFPKSVFDMPLVPDNLCNDIQTPRTSDSFENNFFSAYAVF